MSGESQPNPQPRDEDLLQGLAADFFTHQEATDVTAATEYLAFIMSAQANEKPFRLTKTQRWAAVGSCVALLSWGANAIIQSDDAAEPLGTIVTPSVTPDTQPTNPTNQNRGTPISGKGGAPNYSEFGG